jgi:tetraacyldisaccharide 4'-kinase
LGEAGAKLAGFQAFADHHPYTELELGRLAREAGMAGATLVTTEKDWVRLPKGWRGRIRAVPVGIRWEDEAALASLLARIPAHV